MATSVSDDRPSGGAAPGSTVGVRMRESMRSPEAGERYRPECVESLQAIPAAQWDALVGVGSAPLKHGFLRAWEHAELRRLRSRPVLIRAPSQAKPVAACPGYFYDLDIATVRFPKAAPVTRVVRRLWPDLLYLRTYELGNPTPLTDPFLVREDEPAAVLVPALIEAAVQEASSEGARFILAQTFTSTHGPAGQRLARLGFAAVGAPSAAVVDLPYASFEEYLAAMRAQYRRRAHQTLKRSASLEVEHREQFEDLADELARLWKSIYDRASEVRREVLTPAFFHAASAVDRAHVLLMRRADGTIASFALLIDDHPWLSFVQCGFEAEAGREESAYFRLLYEIVRFAIERRYEQVDLGITTLKPKLDVGAVPVPLIAWIRHRHPLIQRVIIALSRGPLRPCALEPRRVFKEPPPAAAVLVARRGLPS
jgi:predicted N-acyltransferase